MEGSVSQNIDLRIDNCHAGPFGGTLKGIYLVPDFINMHYVSLDSHRNLDINNILRNAGTF